MKNLHYKFIVLAVIALLGQSCKKSGEVIEAPKVAIATFIFNTPSNIPYRLTLDGELLGDSMVNGNRISDRAVVKKDMPQHLVLTNITTNTVVLDSLIDLPTPFFSFLFLELETDSPPVLFNSSDDEPVPGTDSVAIRFLYIDTDLPDSIKMRYYDINTNTFEYAAIDSAVIRRKEMGRYYVANANKYPGGIGYTYFGFDILDAKTGAIIQPLDIDENSAGFGKGVMGTAPFSGSSLIAKKQTLMLRFGYSSFQSDLYVEQYLYGSN